MAIVGIAPRYMSGIPTGAVKSNATKQAPVKHTGTVQQVNTKHNSITLTRLSLFDNSQCLFFRERLIGHYICVGNSTTSYHGELPTEVVGSLLFDLYVLDVDPYIREPLIEWRVLQDPVDTVFEVAVL